MTGYVGVIPPVKGGVIPPAIKNPVNATERSALADKGWARVAQPSVVDFKGVNGNRRG